jgi:glycosyltransferase involved in cell wall biosynthesis
MSAPRTVIGLPTFNREGLLGSALGSLLKQTERDLRVVVLDDRSEDGTVEVARSFARQDPRVEVHVNERRLGMLGNTRRAFALPRRLYPDAEFWALGSDHDLWHPRWLEALLEVLDAHPQVVLAYSVTERVDEHGVPYPRRRPTWRFETRGVPEPRERLRRAFRGMAAGDMIYGLFRADVLDRVGSYRGVLVPDRLLLSEVALRGEFGQVPEVLWSRRFRGLAELDRQREAFWPNGDAPAYVRLPWWQTHAALFAWEYAARGKGADVGLSRVAGARLAVDYLEVSVRHRLWRRARRMRLRAVDVRNAMFGPPVRVALRSRWLRGVARGPVVRVLTAVEEAVERHAPGP